MKTSTTWKAFPQNARSFKFLGSPGGYSLRGHDSIGRMHSRNVVSLCKTENLKKALKKWEKTGPLGGYHLRGTGAKFSTTCERFQLFSRFGYNFRLFAGYKVRDLFLWSTTVVMMHNSSGPELCKTENRKNFSIFCIKSVGLGGYHLRDYFDRHSAQEHPFTIIHYHSGIVQKRDFKKVERFTEILGLLAGYHLRGFDEKGVFNKVKKISTTFAKRSSFGRFRWLVSRGIWFSLLFFRSRKEDKKRLEPPLIPAVAQA